MLIAIILIGFGFAYINGMHDGGNVAATMIASRTMSPKNAVAFSGCCNFFGGILLGTSVAKTVGAGVVNQDAVIAGQAQMGFIFVICALLGGIGWNIITWIIKIPSSSSHALVGGIIGAGVAAYGFQSVLWQNIFVKVILAMFLSPVTGFIIGFLMIKLERRMLKRGKTVWKSGIEGLQKISMLFLAISYGSNDSQKSMGMIGLGLAIAYGNSQLSIPVWTILGCAGALAAGTVFGGFNMIRTIGMNICKVQKMESCASQLATVCVLTVANITGAPISTTQVLTSSVMGVGSGKNPKYVNWGIVRKIGIAWVVTIPAAALVGAGLFYSLYFGIKLISAI